MLDPMFLGGGLMKRAKGTMLFSTEVGTSETGGGFRKCLWKCFWKCYGSDALLLLQAAGALVD